MADEDAKEVEEVQGEEGSKPSRKKLWLLVGGVLFLLLAVGTPVTYFMLAGSGTEETEMVETDAAQKELILPEGYEEENAFEEGEEALGAIFPLDTLVVNLKGGGFLRVQIQLEFVERDIPRRFYKRLVPIRDGLLALLASKTREDLLEGSGRATMKQEVKESVNESLRRADVKQVFFTTFIVQ